MSNDDKYGDRDEVIRRTVINLLAHDMLLKDFAALKKDAKEALERRNAETTPEMVHVLMTAVATEEAKATLFRIFGSDPKVPPPAEDGPPKGVFIDLTNKPGEPLSWSESLEDIIGPEEEEP